MVKLHRVAVSESQTSRLDRAEQQDFAPRHQWAIIEHGSDVFADQ